MQHLRALLCGARYYRVRLPYAIRVQMSIVRDKQSSSQPAASQKAVEHNRQPSKTGNNGSKRAPPTPYTSVRHSAASSCRARFCVALPRTPPGCGSTPSLPTDARPVTPCSRTACAYAAPTNVLCRPPVTLPCRAPRVLPFRRTYAAPLRACCSPRAATHLCV